MDVATLFEHHIRIPVGLFSVGVHNAFERGSTSRRRKTLLDDMSEAPNKHLFMKYLNMFIEVDSFVPGMAPFLDRSFSPKWFKNHFPCDSPQDATQSSVV